jgi:hypothetical protein
LPLLDPLRFALGEIAAHREWRFGHVDRIFAGLAVRLAWFVIGHKIGFKFSIWYSVVRVHCIERALM